MSFHMRMGHEHDELVYARCGCGFWVVYTPDGWQHDSAPYFWGDDHEPQVDSDALNRAHVYDMENCDHSFLTGVCLFCGVIR